MKPMFATIILFFMVYVLCHIPFVRKKALVVIGLYHIPIDV